MRIGLAIVPVRLSTTSMQMFASCTFPAFTTLNLSTEDTCNRTTQCWTVPAIAALGRLVKRGRG